MQRLHWEYLLSRKMTQWQGLKLVNKLWVTLIYKQLPLARVSQTLDWGVQNVCRSNQNFMIQLAILE